MMCGFGKCQGGGRRSAARTIALLSVVVTTLARSQTAVLVDVSSTGARLRGPDLPEPGDDLFIKVERTEKFATVAWSREDECGIEFDGPITDLEVEELRRTAAAASLMRLTPEERLAMEDWVLGPAR
jgi:PilZ domain-containing protein